MMRLLNNAKREGKFDARNRLPHHRVVDRNRFALRRKTFMDQPKRPEPEIAPPVPKTEPRRGDVEIPPDKDVPEKRSPASGEER